MFAAVSELLLEAGIGVLGGVLVVLGVWVGVRVYRLGRGDRS